MVARQHIDKTDACRGHTIPNGIRICRSDADNATENHKFISARTICDGDTSTWRSIRWFMCEMFDITIIQWIQCARSWITQYMRCVATAARPSIRIVQDIKQYDNTHKSSGNVTAYQTTIAATECNNNCRTISMDRNNGPSANTEFPTKLDTGLP